MVNARNISLAALASVVTIAVVGVETYKSGTYKAQVNFHGAFSQDISIERAALYTESSEGCGELGRATKGDTVACFENGSETTEMKIELGTGLVIVQVGDDQVGFQRTESGLEEIFSTTIEPLSADNAGSTMALPTATRNANGVVTKIESGDMKLIVDNVVSGAAAQHLDFSEEEVASGRSLLASRSAGQTRQLFGKKKRKKYKKWLKKHKKKLLCAAGIAAAATFLGICLFGVGAATIATFGLGAYAIMFCGAFAVLPGAELIMDHCH